MYRVQVRPKDGDPVILTVSVYAESWTDAVKRAVRCLTDEMVPEDRDAIGRSEFQCSIHRRVTTTSCDRWRTSDSGMRSTSTPVPGEEFDDLVVWPPFHGGQGRGRCAKTVNNPRGWRPQAVPQAADMAPKIKSDRLKPTGKSVERAPARNPWTIYGGCGLNKPSTGWRDRLKGR